MESHNIKVQRVISLLLLLLLCSFAVAKQAVPDCCQQKSCSCRILKRLHGMGGHATGILTIGKRSGTTTARGFQSRSRLYHLLHGSGSQAAGILTMGKRAGGLTLALKDNVPSIPQMMPTTYAAGPDLVTGCLSHLGKDLTSGQNTSAIDSIY